MSDEDSGEISALVVGFLTQSLKEHPEGYSIRDFERFFPERSDEPTDWFKRYKKRNTLEALLSISDHVEVYQNDRYRSQFVRLNRRSDKVDPHLVDLITHQRSSNKKRSARPYMPPSSRALTSFSLNRQYSSHSSRSYGHPSRLNHDQHYRDSSFIKKSSPPTSSSRYSKPSSQPRITTTDPRLKSACASSFPAKSSSSASRPTPPPPQAPRTQPAPTSQKPHAPPNDLSRSSSHLNQSLSKVVSHSHSLSSSKPKENKKDDDPGLIQKKVYLRQRLQSLLSRKTSEIKLLHLNGIYELEFDEKIDPISYGHRDLTALLQDTEISNYIQLNFKAPLITISAKNRTLVIEKENVQSNGSSKQSLNNHPTTATLSDKSNTLSSTKFKLEAVDPFNVRSMLFSLDPLGKTKDPILNPKEVDDSVKYRTMRLIFKAPDSKLKLDEWEAKFEQESRLKIRIRDYGFKTNLEFFKFLAKELPIEIQLNKQDEWIAQADHKSLSSWLHSRLVSNDWKAITAIDKRYELVATPSDTYNFESSDKLLSNKHKGAVILSMKNAHHMWLRLRSKEATNAHLNIESSMTSYEDYKEGEIFSVPTYYIRPGFPCAAFDTSQQLWCRALITKTPTLIDKNYEITALLVDYGVERKFAISELSCLMRVHIKIPVGPIYAGLTGIKGDSIQVQKRAKMILQGYANPPLELGCKFLVNNCNSGLPQFLPQKRYKVSLVDLKKGCALVDLINITDSTVEGC